MDKAAQHRIGRRRLLAGAAGAAAATVAAGIPARLSAAQASELRILFPGGTWKDWYDQTFVTPFAKKHGITLSKISTTIHAYPTLTEVTGALGREYRKTKLTPKTRDRLAKVYRWLRR